MNTHDYFMDIALGWARSAKGQTAPNPMVGAVVVKDGEIVGMGAHLKAGEPHAEIHALAMASNKARGATIYVTLEPCSHYGRTPPCAEALIRAGVSRVVVAMLDPNPLVAGRGVQLLEDAGIEVISGIRERESRRLNEVFIKYITTGRPFVTMKTANTLDGKVATEIGSSRWITGEKARIDVHRLRHEYQGILVGVNTVIKDNPVLTTRLPEGGRNPIRIILDSTLRIPLESNIVQDHQAPTWIYTTRAADERKTSQLKEMGVEVFAVSSGGQVDVLDVLSHLGEQQVSSVLVEGGSEVNGSFLKAKAIDKVITYLAPKLVGGRHAPTSFGGEGILQMNEAIQLRDLEVEIIGEDIRIEGYPEWGD
ncbi:bifunctional diaminohydroxyphosphoribosylaminopyrimidine deaminase/5-amino-6-(5-phosphoribosylamino)uracil reductase RibD [Ammoniphilus sp. CFH 90114]|uniref:bifunctional diaminohydroxyphosphoribosylaminopyrimidine deaminase/5-amino-6-(5-phosphoribosylamino)uracil reductase RibD n=1 Tax=Ammoniphilus sp. CFH 90114 TaxID=2493665 RepID=UPI00100F6616|nr:bifunctional diaminohydroxyphosphoribosylaminopyrimidine deaminase/5-amino-6-(5-phosphoribosylamino)uracil reductase RibD [Ammoniphilus sp. CFH 90114]RXT15521.1 bifunctional diaminohydroxyphosphoribosylaminopyrimidine deaminase/5-amino-6-(5-phosphoribosylamino)uracil reductase RibD [Ammoniphilus sp. CFH 90114]